MTLYFPRLILIFFLSFVSFETLAFKEELIVDEFIGESVRLRILNGEDNDIDVLISYRNKELSRGFLQAIEGYSITKGLDLTLESSNKQTLLSFALHREGLDDLLKFLKDNQSEFQNAQSFEILVLGNVNQQKILGKLYSQWGKFSADTNVDFSFQYNFNSDEKKNRKLLWTRIFSILLSCTKEEQLTLQFLLQDDDIKCNLNSSKRMFAPGEIANIKSSLYSLLQIERNNDKELLKLLSNFHLNNSLVVLDEFISVLPELSIEEIHSQYLETTANLQVAEVKPEQIERTSQADEDSSSLIKFISSKQSVWGISLVIDAEVDVCRYINCRVVRKQLTFEHYYADKTWLYLWFHSRDLDKQMDFIAEEVIKPLSFKGYFTDSNTKIFAFGPSNKSPLRPVLNATNVDIADYAIEPMFSNLKKDSSVDSECYYGNQIGSPYWANQLLHSYSHKYFNNKKSISRVAKPWNIFFDLCISSKQVGDAFLEKKEFLTLKNALIAKVQRLDEESYIYQSVASYYGLDPKTQLLEQLAKLTFDEYQYLYGAGS
ncbi:MAG: hypothetical protein HWE16_01285 [Gammaproteobacteria bacterium]|nr:hypothetical protein [Gammaproteobacteria bacterium]